MDASNSPSVFTFSGENAETKSLANVHEVGPSISLLEDSRYSDYIAHLLKLGQLLCTLADRHVEFFCQEIKVITQNQVFLHLDKQASFLPNTFSIIEIQFNHAHYGYLYVTRDKHHPHQPAIPLFVAYVMAQIISYILHMLEQHLFIRSFQKPVLEYGLTSLTRREQDVLALLCRGYTQEEIAERLNISLTTVNSHRQHIYEHFGVHNEYAARMAAYRLGLVSFLTIEE
ncbi:MAG TPA: helix-turn-helix transcriptional regulator [Ktedonosporobacter sp.]|jgi:DNA-binding NarL/FixJ family response regulator|nr:helix-turn-helix transcriptional regulator [Ktedonosporobacter sp.]